MKKGDALLVLGLLVIVIAALLMVEGSILGEFWRLGSHLGYGKGKVSSS